MIRFGALKRSADGSAAVEMALVMPLLLAILCGSFELGNYFLNEHTLVEAVRDGARFAARQSFSNYSTCSGSPGGTVVSDTQNVVKKGLLSGSDYRVANWSAFTISVTMSCTTSAGGQTMSGIYSTRATGAPVVTVAASGPYYSVLHAFGFRGVSYNLYASQQAAVAGI